MFVGLRPPAAPGSRACTAGIRAALRLRAACLSSLRASSGYVVRMSSKHKLSLITFDIDDTLYASTDFARTARDNALRAMIASGMDLPFEDAVAELDEVVSEFSSNDEHHFDRLLDRIPQKALSGFNP